MAEYLEPNYQNIKLADAQFLFQLKTKVVSVKGKYSNSFKENMNCALSEKEGRVKKHTQKHVMRCHVIMRHVTNQDNTKYKDLQGKNLTEQLILVKQFKINYLTREKLMNEEKKQL